jgi:hypothetical protein
MEILINKKYNFATASFPVSLDLTSDVQDYYFSGTLVLAGNLVVQTTGTPVDGMRIWIYYDGTGLTLGGNSVTVIGKLLTAKQAVSRLIIFSTYVTAAWVTRVFVDNSQTAWVTKGDLDPDIVDDVTVENDPANGLQLKALGITNAKVNDAAAIALSKLAALTASRLAITDGSGFLSAADVATYPSLAELAFLKGVTSAIQTQLGTKTTSGAIVNADINAAAAIVYSKLLLTGSIVNADINAAAAIAYSKLALTGSIVNADINAAAAIALSKLAALTASRAAVTDGGGVITTSAVTSTELSYLSGVTSAIQTQINAIDTTLSSNAKTAADVTLTSATIKRYYEVQSGAGIRTLTLPLASTLAANYTITVVRKGGNNVVIAANAADQINDITGANVASVTLAATGDSATLIYDSANVWSVFVWED